MKKSIAVLRCVSMALLATSAMQAARAQAEVLRGLDQSPTRVLQIANSEGTVSLRRAGSTVGLKPGFLVFSEDRVMLAPRARAELELARHGQIHFATRDADAALSFERLPFSSWAVDLETRMRLEGGALRVRWMRPRDAADWPLAVDLDRWSADLGNGEFLFKREASGATVCVLSGKLDLVGAESGSGRITPQAGRCVELRAGDAPREVALVAEQWSDLRANLAVAAYDEEPARSLELPPPNPEAQAAVAEPVVTSPPPVTAEPAREEIPVAGPAPAVPAADAAVAAEVVPAVAAISVVVADAVPLIAVPPPAPVEPAPQVEPAPRVETTPAGEPAAPVPAPAETAVAASAPPAAPVVETPVAPPVSAAPVVARTTLDTPASLDAGPEWIVNVMTVTDPEVANRHLKTLTDAGYPAVLRQEIVRGRGSYRIVIGGIANEAGARRVAELLATKLGYAAAWPLQKR